ncbi:hypothetical protein ACV34H_32420, partial [Pseudomonas aeruginosa]
LPFVRGGLSDDPRLIAASRALLQAMDTPLEPLEEQDALFELAHALDAVAGEVSLDAFHRTVLRGASNPVAGRIG